MQNSTSKFQSSIENYIKSNNNGRILVLGNDLRLYYMKNQVDGNFILSGIQQMYFNSSINFEQYFNTLISPIGKNENIKSVGTGLIKGDIMGIYKNIPFRIIGAEKVENRGIPNIEKEVSFEGGSEAFNEVTTLNVNIVAQYYHNYTLTTQRLTVGEKGHNNVVIMYDSAYVNEDLLKDVIKRLNEIDVPMVQSLNGLQQLLWKKQLLVPRMLVTQRPDRVTDYIGKGKIVIFLDGTPNALILPVSFHDFMKTVDDEYLLPIPALFLIILRYFALLLSIALPAAYVAIISYNPEVLRVQLVLSIATSRIGVPYPSFVEVTIMLILMEFLVESSLRLPKTIGQTATTVGGLILGQAALQAHLVSNIMIIIVSTVAISNFMMPVISMNLSVRVLKYALLAFVSFTGVYGLYLGLYCIAFYLSSLHTFNEPYFNPAEKITIGGIKHMLKRGQ